MKPTKITDFKIGTIFKYKWENNVYIVGIVNKNIIKNCDYIEFKTLATRRMRDFKCPMLFFENFKEHFIILSK